MKSIFAALLLLSTTVFAQVNPGFAPRTVLKIEQIDENIRQITLDETGTVRVSPRYRGFETVFSLTDANESEIIDMVRSLSKAEMITERRTMVCKMVANPHTERTMRILDFDYSTLGLVLSPTGCMYSEITHPKHEEDRLLAYELRSLMIVLARQYFN